MASLPESQNGGPVVPNKRWRWLREACEPLIAALLFMAAVTKASEFWNVYQHSPDEGFNLMKTALVMSGYSLYSEIWSDQPPVFTYALLPLQLLYPGNVNPSRILVLVFAGWIVVSLFRIVRRSHGTDAAWLSSLALLGAYRFDLISTYVLIGLPAVAFALAGVDQALAGAKDGRRWRFILAGLLFGLGLQTKLFTTLMLPTILLAAFTEAADRAAWRRAGVNAAILALSIAVAFLAIAFALGEPIVEQLIEPHTGAEKVAKFAQNGGFVVIWDSLKPHFIFAPLPLGFLLVAMRRRLVDMLPLLWLCLSVVVLVLHRPYWAHQGIMIVVPAAWLSSVGIALFTQRIYRRAAFACVAVILAGAVAWSLSELAREGPMRAVSETPLQARNTEFRKWAVTDFVMDAYRAKWLVPPELAVFSDKRISSGLLTGADLVEAFDKYQPQEILFRRFRPGGGLVRTLQEDYRPARKTGGFIHAIRKTESAPRIEIKREEVIAALTIATADLASLSVGGGYPAHVDLKTGQHFGRSLKNEPLAPNEITTRPLGSTQEVGQCLRRVGLATDDELFQMLALSAGKALACSQRYGGGWGNSSIITASCSKTAADDEDHPMTIDDRATPSALDFLLDLRNDVSSAGGTLPGWLEPAITAGLKSLLEAQSEKGGWRQTYPPRDDPYAKDFTFNDGAISSVISTLVKAYHSTNDGQYRDAALRGGEFILATQGPEGQDGWAQQYGADLKPAAARTFEPVGYSSRETGDVMNTLLDLFAETGDERFAAAVAKARRWLDASEIRPETWARLYEPGTNRPIYGDRDGSVHYSLSEISEERQRGYEWQGSFDSVLRARARDDARIEGGVEGLKAFDEQAREPLPLSGEDLDRLSKLAQEVSRSGRWADGDIVSTAVFVQNCALLTRSLAELE